MDDFTGEIAGGVRVRGEGNVVQRALLRGQDTTHEA